jgi:hypothetical protein
MLDTGPASRPTAPLAVARLEKVQESGWGLGMHLVPLRNGGLLVHSPTWLGPATFGRVEALGRPEVLLAPNHFHHLSLHRFRERYPDALAVATEAALPRLVRRGHVGLRTPEAAEPLLPEGTRFLVPPGLRTGEVWLSVPEPDGRTLLVCDAFFNVERPVRGLHGLVLRALGVTPGLVLPRPFEWLAVRERGVYGRWVLRTLEEERPWRLRVSHGEPADGADLPERLATLVRRRLLRSG